MFKLQPKSTFWAKVHVSVAGEAKPEQIEMEFKYLGRDALKEYFQSLEGKTDSDALGEIVLNWRLVDAEYSPENLAILLNNYPGAALSVFETFRREVMEAKTKN